MSQSSSAEWPIQKAIYSRLTTGGGGATPLTCSVYDDVPSTPVAFPYAVLGMDDQGEWRTKTWNGREVVATVDIWSDYDGAKEAKDLVNVAVKALTASELDLSADNFAVCWSGVESNSVEPYPLEPEGLLRHGTVRMRYRVQQLA